jgi:hypothetical protein
MSYSEGKEKVPQEMFVVPKGHVWLEGDNPSWSIDSRVYGPVPVNMVEGKLFLRVSQFQRSSTSKFIIYYKVTPFSKIGWAPHDESYFDKFPQGHSKKILL